MQSKLSVLATLAAAAIVMAASAGQVPANVTSQEQPPVQTIETPTGNIVVTNLLADLAQATLRWIEAWQNGDENAAPTSGATTTATAPKQVAVAKPTTTLVEPFRNVLLGPPQGVPMDMKVNAEGFNAEGFNPEIASSSGVAMILMSDQDTPQHPHLTAVIVETTTNKVWMLDMLGIGPESEVSVGPDDGITFADATAFCDWAVANGYPHFQLPPQAAGEKKTEPTIVSIKCWHPIPTQSVCIATFSDGHREASMWCQGSNGAWNRCTATISVSNSGANTR